MGLRKIFFFNFLFCDGIWPINLEKEMATHSSFLAWEIP